MRWVVSFTLRALVPGVVTHIISVGGLWALQTVHVALEGREITCTFLIWNHELSVFQAVAHSLYTSIFFFSSVISNQSTWVLYELMCWLSLVVRSPPARRSLSWIQSTVDWCMAPPKRGFDLKSNSTIYPDHGHHGDPPPHKEKSPW